MPSRTAREHLRWNGWGREDVGFPLRGRAEPVFEFVAKSLGVDALPHTPAPRIEDTILPAPRTSEALLAKLREALGEPHVADGLRDRAMHAHGRSYHDVLRLRSGRLEVAPDVVVYPASEAEIATVLALAEEHHAAVVPYGGGSSVVGGVDALRGERAQLICLDTSRLDRVLEVDGISRTATFEAGIYGPELESALAARGFVLGHHPQSFEFSTLGGWIAARSSGQLSNRYGSIDKLVEAVRVVTPRGVLTTSRLPASAAGPNLNHVVLGSEGTLGVIASATMRIRPLPEARGLFAFLFKHFDEGSHAVRAIVQADVGAAMLRLSDADETHFFGAFRAILEPSRMHGLGETALGMAGFGAKCVLMVCLEGDAATVATKTAAIRSIARAHGGFYVGESPGRAWWSRRFEMPYLRDPLLDRGIGLDTLETATTWANLGDLYRTVGTSLRDAFAALGKRAIVMAHISHSYPDGASLYFTFLFERDRDDPVAEWKRVKHAASRAIVEGGGTISHHHGVGTDHAPYLGVEKGALGLDLIDAMRRTCDPRSVLSPGKLVVASER